MCPHDTGMVGMGERVDLCLGDNNYKELELMESHVWCAEEHDMKLDQIVEGSLGPSSEIKWWTQGHWASYQR